MVARRGRLAYVDSLGQRDRDAGAAMAEDAMFRIYSMTKPLVSVATMMLFEEGRLQLADPVSKFLPAFKDMQVSVSKTNAFGKVSYTLVPADREMTVQDLLRHTAGLAYGGITHNAQIREAYQNVGVYGPDASGLGVYRDMTPAEQVERLAQAPLVHHPGTMWEYSLASDLLGRVVEAVSGERLSDFLARRLFEPLGLADTAFWVPADKLPRLAEPLPVDPATGKPNQLMDVTARPANDSGGAGAVSTASDYLRFAQMLLDGGKLGDVRILSRTTVALMASDHLGTAIDTTVPPGVALLGSPGYTFGLGFAVREPSTAHTVPGSAGEFMWAGFAGTYFWIDPTEELAVVLMTQAPGPSRRYYRRLVKQLVYQAIIDE
jgi:CubicO group peptidase (beta-lactamase class C family)